MVTTPNSIGIYQRYMAPMWDDRDGIIVPTGFQAIIHNGTALGGTHFSDNAEVVDIDIQRGDEKAASLVPRGGISRSLGSIQKSLNEEKFTNVNRVYPLSIELADISSAQLNKRASGEEQYSGASREFRLRKLSIKAMKETVRRTARMFEILCAQSVRTGVQDMIIGTTDSDMQLDWSRNAGNTNAAAAVWNTGTPDIIADLETAADAIRENGHTRPDVAIIGASGMAAFIKDSTLQNLSNNRRYELLTINDKNSLPGRLQFMIDAGFDSRGMVSTYKGRTLYLFTYDEGYTNASNVYTPYMPIGEAIVFDSRARCDRYFGPPETLPMDSAMRAFYQDRYGLSPNALPSVQMRSKSGIIMPEMFHFDAYPNGDNTAITHRTQSAPIFGTTHVDAFARITGLVS